MTIRMILLITIPCLLAACATRAPLQSPCPPIASLAAADDCGPEKPINIAGL